MPRSPHTIVIDEKPAVVGGPIWLCIDGECIHVPHGEVRQLDETIVAIAQRAWELGYAAAQEQMREALGLPV